VRHVAGQHEQNASLAANLNPRGTRAWSYGAGGDLHITAVTVGSSGEYKDGLLGFFTDDQGQKYFMLTNLWHDKGGTADDFTLAFTLKFKPQVKDIYRLNRLSGKSEPIKPIDGVVTLRLPGGTGDLFKYTPGPFPGSMPRQ